MAEQREQSQDFLYSAEQASHHEATPNNGRAESHSMVFSTIL